MKEAYEAIKSSVLALYEKIGFQYRASFVYGSLAQGFYQPGQSDVNLLIVVEDGTSIHQVREALQPIWTQYGPVLQHMPGIATKSAFDRHMTLFPLLARHVDKYGKQVRGSRRTLGRTASLDRGHYVGRVAAQALTASLALAPSLLVREGDVASTEQLLRHMVRKLRRTAVGQGENTADLFFEAQAHVQSELADLGDHWSADPPANPPYPIPNLLAVYEKLDYLVLIVEDIAALRGYDWAALASQLQGRYSGVQVATADQIRLIATFENPLEYVLRTYRHNWGHDPLANLTPSIELALRDAARFASQIEIFDMPHAYITASEEQFGKLVHDFQNKLLNSRLQNELLARLGLTTSQQPPMPLPDRTAPAPERIEAIFAHLAWWSEFYTNQMRQGVQVND